MEETKNLCAQIPVSLHNRIRREQEQKGQTLSQYVTDVLNSYYNGGKCMENTRTMAFQISEELFQRIKEHLVRESTRSGKKLTQREFILGLIEDALERAEDAVLCTETTSGESFTERSDEEEDAPYTVPSFSAAT